MTINDKINDRSQQFKLVRLLLLLLLTGSYFFFQSALGISFPVFPWIALGAVILVTSLVSYAIEGKLHWTRLFAPVRILLDLVVLSLLAYFTGGIKSPFIFLLFIPIISFNVVYSSVLFNALIVGLAILAYGLIFFAPAYGPIGYPSEAALFTARACVLLLTLGFITFSSTLLVNNLEQEEHEAKLAKDEYEKINGLLEEKAKERERLSHFMVDRDKRIAELEAEARQLEILPGGGGR